MTPETRVRNIFKIRIPGITEDLQYRISRAGGRTSLGGNQWTSSWILRFQLDEVLQQKSFPCPSTFISAKGLCGNQKPNVPLRRPRSLNPGLSYQNTGSPDRKAQGMKQGLERNWWKVGFQRTFPSAPINVILYLYNRVSPTDSGTKLFL